MTEEYKGEAHYWTEDADGDPVLPVGAESTYVQSGQPWQDELEADMERKTVQKWADQAMFTAEPIRANEGPKVYLLWMTADPLAVIAAPSKMYKGEVVRSLRDVTHAERREYVEQLKNTKLKAPYEFVKFHFLIEGVTRAFTHQMVRQRTAVYAQESLRFAVKEDMPVGLPPSLAGVPPERVVEFENCASRDEAQAFWDMMSAEERKLAKWRQNVNVIGNAYRELVDGGMPAEDARGLLPHNTLTRLHYCTDLRALLDHAGNRLCTQAQFEWRLVFAKITQAIREYNPYAQLRQWAVQDRTDSGLLLADWLDQHTEVDRWQYEAIADLFRPVCYQTGKCEFKANFDRNCSIRERVDKFAARNVPSGLWGFGAERSGGKFLHEGYLYEGIRPAEWLADPGSAL